MGLVVLLCLLLQLWQDRTLSWPNHLDKLLLSCLLLSQLLLDLCEACLDICRHAGQACHAFLQLFHSNTSRKKYIYKLANVPCYIPPFSLSFLFKAYIIHTYRSIIEAELLWKHSSLTHDINKNNRIPDRQPGSAFDQFLRQVNKVFFPWKQERG